MKNRGYIYIYLLIGLIICNLNSNAQSFVSNVIESQKLHRDTIETNSNKPLFKPNVSLNLGTSFTTFGNQMNGFSTFVAPEIGMPVSKNIEISFGLAYSNMNLNSNGEFPISQNSSYGSMYVSGTYHVNTKLSIRATGYKTFLLNPDNFNTDNQNSYLDFSNQGAILDLEYRITDNFKINASFQYHEQNSPNFYFSNPYGGHGGFNGFSNPSTSGFGTFNSFGPGY